VSTALQRCEVPSLTSREEHRLRVSENRVLRKIFEPKMDEVTEEWRRAHNEELDDLYCSPNTVRVIESGIIDWAEHAARMGNKRCVYRVLVGRPDGKTTHGRCRRTREENIEMYEGWNLNSGNYLFTTDTK